MNAEEHEEYRKRLKFQNQSLDHGVAVIGSDILDSRYQVKACVQATLAAVAAVLFVQEERIPDIGHIMAGIGAVYFGVKTGVRALVISACMSRLSKLRTQHPQRLRMIISEMRKQLPYFAENADRLQQKYFPDAGTQQ